MKNFEIKQFNDGNQPFEINNFKKSWTNCPTQDKMVCQQINGRMILTGSISKNCSKFA